MYRGFNLEIPNDLDFDTDKIKKYKAKMLAKTRNHFIDYIMTREIIDGNKVIEQWFPIVECDIFLSHSHKDQSKAIMLAIMLEENLGLKTFVDSTVWGYSDSLLKVIDDYYCKHENGESYCYEKRNFSTAHIHLMLNSALNKMIDSCEAIFFMNTPNSITPDDTINNKTMSPWIFSEIMTTQIIRKKTPQRLRKETRIFSANENLNESVKTQLNIEYQIELSHLTKLSLNDIKTWIKNAKLSYETPLDVLYNYHNINNKFLI
ncbi:hypothetical protein [Pontimicrobium sp. MEBiC06410]